MQSSKSVGNNKDIKTEEICKNGKTEKYRNELEMAVNLARNKGFTVSGHYISFQSSTDWGSKCIHIALKDGAARELDLIWDLLHEIGHTFDGEPDKDLSSEEKHKRELNAWSNAWGLVEKEFPTLMEFYHQFCLRKEHCLQTYLNRCS